MNIYQSTDTKKLRSRLQWSLANVSSPENPPLRKSLSKKVSPQLINKYNSVTLTNQQIVQNNYYSARNLLICNRIVFGPFHESVDQNSNFKTKRDA